MRANCVVPNLDASGNRIAGDRHDEDEDTWPLALRWHVGDTIQDKAKGYIHTYRLAAIRPYTSPRTGHETALLHWRGSCVVCGTGFIAITGRRPRELARTCLDHRGQWLPQRRRTSAEGAANG